MTCGASLTAAIVIRTVLVSVAGWLVPPKLPKSLATTTRSSTPLALALGVYSRPLGSANVALMAAIVPTSVTVRAVVVW